jgi:16S rRNA (cytidine1402-2'-O)-methyltransferase
MSDSGILYIVATPIGNLEDISLRALRILREADIIAAEDTRVTRKLLSHYDIHTPITSCHEHTNANKLDDIIEKMLQEQTVALVSDAGLPGISDPGQRLIRKAIESAIPVIPVPGPNAALSGLIVSGLPTERFVFLGFPPRTKTDRNQFFEEMANQSLTIILYESPRRRAQTLEDIAKHLGNIAIAVARELTKVHEEVFRGTVWEALDHYASHPPRGEITIVARAEAIRRDAPQQSMGWEEKLRSLIESGMRPVDAARMVSKEYGLPKKTVYDFHVRNTALK